MKTDKVIFVFGFIMLVLALSYDYHMNSKCEKLGAIHVRGKCVKVVE
jgi:hypothetical protein